MEKRILNNGIEVTEFVASIANAGADALQWARRRAADTALISTDPSIMQTSQWIIEECDHYLQGRKPIRVVEGMQEALAAIGQEALTREQEAKKATN